MSRTLLVVLSIGLIAAVSAIAVPRAAAGQEDEQTHACTNASLRGEYGVLVSGVRGTPAGFGTSIATMTVFRLT